ncbi:MAG: DNA/RNA non-specific endonuclease [Alistipes sp.]|nr:DNA/RNA non-specific endonuclease [Alistipes sp.]
MKRFIAFRFLFALAAVFAIAACDETGVGNGEEPPVDVDVPVIVVDGERTVKADADGGTFRVRYSVTDPVEGIRLTAKASADWITDIVCNASSVDFEIASNANEKSRTAELTLAYTGAESVTVLVEQAEAGEQPTPPVTTGQIILTTDSGWPTSYSKDKENVVKMEGYEFYVYYTAVYSSSNGIQFKSGDGFVANKDDFGYIISVDVEYKSSANANCTLFTGVVYKPSLLENEVEGVKSDDGRSVHFDCSGRNHRFFNLANGSGVSYAERIIITYASEQGGDNPDPTPDVPSFADVEVESVSDDAATVVCTLIYDKTITSAGVMYKTAAESTYRELQIPSVSHELRAELTGLASGTDYDFRFYVEADGKLYKSDEFDFTTTSNGGTTPPSPVTGDTYRSGWPELPIEADADGNGIDDNDNTLYYAHHLCAGPEKNAQGNASARNYTVCYSAEHHCPVWVAAPRHDSYNGSANRTDAYGKDPKILSSIQYNSKSTGGGCNKGHMLGSAERTCSSATNRQVFYYTNIAPQYSSTFNTGGGAWNNLEEWVDSKVCADTLYVVIGCYFDTFSDKRGNTATPTVIEFGGRSDVSCPTMFYYAMLRTKRGNTRKSVKDCSASELQCAAFVKCHKAKKGDKPSAADMMTIEELEKLTGFTYFPNVPNAPKSTCSASDWGL